MIQSYRPFERSLSANIVDLLKAAPLFQQQLLPDILLDPSLAGSAGKRIFPAIRQEQVDFYYQGSRIFSFDRGGFRTHTKYAAVFESGERTIDEIRESDLAHIRPIHDFTSGYPAMKKLCALYAGVEAQGVSAIYSRFPSVLASCDRPVVVLDIEASFDATAIGDNGSESVQDRMDLVLLDIQSRRILCVEAKHLSNPELRAAEGPAPVVGQVQRYRQQLQIQNENILAAYCKSVRALNYLFGTALPEPESIIPDVPVLIFGFDSAQRESFVHKIMDSLNAYGIPSVAIGDPALTAAGTLKRWVASAS